MTSAEPIVVDDLPCGYVEIGPDGIVTTANRSFLRLADRAEDDIVGQRTFTALLAVGDRMYYETHVRPTLDMTGEIHEIAAEIVRPGGERVPVLVSASTAGGAAPVTRLAIFEARDRRTYEKELLRARRAAEQAEAHAQALARTLQQTFVPPTMPEIPGLDLAGAYRPAGDGSEVGGDFYDVFQIHSGEWVLALGDVSGKGVDAAVVTAFVRHSLRALAVQHDSPADILRALNETLIAHRTDRFCTVLVIRLLREDDRWLMTISSGGHPLPLLVSADGSIAEVGAPGSLLGVLTHPQLGDARDTLVAGDRLLLYTDGVTDARGDHGAFGLDGLLAVLSEGPASAVGTSERVLERVLDFQSGTARDDIAIVAVEVLDSATRSPATSPGVRTDVEEKNRALRELARQAGESSRA